MITPHKHGQSGEQRVEAPVLGEVGDDDGPHRLGGEHGLPGGRHHALLGAHPDRRAKVFQLGVGDIPNRFTQRCVLQLLNTVLHMKPFARFEMLNNASNGNLPKFYLFLIVVQLIYMPMWAKNQLYNSQEIN